MKAKNILLIAALAFGFMACEKNEPFDTQSADDQPRILVPYETTSGKITAEVYYPSAYVDSVVVTPSAYTTVNWYLDGALVHTADVSTQFKINKQFPTGVYTMLIEAVTTAGKRSTREGVLYVHPSSTDPYSAAPASGRHLVPNTSVTLSGTNLTKVVKLVLSKDLYAKDTVCTISVTTTDDASLSFTLPALADGRYYLRLQDAEGNLFGAGDVNVHNASVALSGYESFAPNKEWVITGVSLQDVASVQVDTIVITDLTATETSVTLTAPNVAVGEHTVSITNKDGSSVLFITTEGAVDHATAVVSAETTIWENGPVALKWDAERVKVVKEVMDEVPVGATIYVYFEKLPDGDENYYDGEEYKQYYALRIITPWWGDNPEDNILPQTDMGSESSPYSFTYDAHGKALVDERGAMCLVGWGLNILKITYK